MVNLSVVIPAYNAEGCVEAAVRSAFDAGATQVIVTDDGSTDATAVLAGAAGAEVIRQQNSGAAAARRAGANHATGDFVVLLDADDRLRPRGVARSLEVLANSLDAELVMGRTVGRGRADRRRVLSHWPEGVTLDSLLARGYAPGPPAAFVWRRRALLGVLAESPPAVWPKYAEDYEFLVRAALRGRIVAHDEVSCEYAWVGGKSSLAPERSIRDAERIRMHYARAGELALKPRNRRQLFRMVALRKASECLSPMETPRRIALTVLALAADPRFAIEKIARRVRPTAAATGSVGLWSTLRADWSANTRDPKSILVLTLFRLCQAAMGGSRVRRILAAPLEASYRVLTEGVLGIELRPKTQVGPGLSIYHGVGLVVNDHAVIGENVKLRNGVTIGHQVPGGGVPVIGDDVSVGAGAILLGQIRIGRGARIGAGAVVTKSVEPFDTVVGNPARSIRTPKSESVIGEPPE